MEQQNNNCNFPLPNTEQGWKELIEEIEKLPKNENKTIDC